MSHGLMHGMFWAGVLLSSIPILLGLGIAVYTYRNWQIERERRRLSAVREES